MAYPMTATGVGDFIGFLAAKGLLNAGAAASTRTACEKLFSALDEDERLNLSNVDVDQAIARFMNKNPGVLSPASGNVYRGRVQKALKMLKEYNANPAGFKVNPTKRTQSSGGAEKKSSNDGKPVRSQSERVSNSPLEQPHASSSAHEIKNPSSVSLSFPLRQDFIAQFILPTNLTLKEARRLGAYFEVLAVDFERD
jgi:hypothetical protein